MSLQNIAMTGSCNNKILIKAQIISAFGRGVLKLYAFNPIRLPMSLENV